MLGRIKAVAAQINLQGWAEANAGNISVDVSSVLHALGLPEAAWFLVSRTCSRWRDMALDPLPQLVLIASAGDTEEIYPPDQRPSSEWACHRGLQQLFRDRDNGDRVVLHAHPSPVILLSQLATFSDEARLNSALAEALPEFPLFLPEGVALAPYALPGSPELAACSLGSIGSKRALLWPGHGLVCAGRDPDDALDLLEVAAKAVELAICKFFLTKLST